MPRSLVLMFCGLIVLIASCHIDNLSVEPWPNQHCLNGLDPSAVLAVDTGLPSFDDFQAQARPVAVPEVVLAAVPVPGLLDLPPPIAAEQADPVPVNPEPVPEAAALVPVEIAPEPPAQAPRAPVQTAAAPKVLRSQPPQATLLQAKVLGQEEPAPELLTADQPPPNTPLDYGDVPDLAPAPLEDYGLPVTAQAETPPAVPSEPAEQPADPSFSANELANLDVLGISPDEMRILEWQAHICLAAKLYRQLQNGGDPELAAALRQEISLADKQPAGATMPVCLTANDQLTN